jgi:hypothetical protein
MEIIPQTRVKISVPNKGLPPKSVAACLRRREKAGKLFYLFAPAIAPAQAVAMASRLKFCAAARYFLFTTDFVWPYASPEIGPVQFQAEIPRSKAVFPSPSISGEIAKLFSRFRTTIPEN